MLNFYFKFNLFVIFRWTTFYQNQQHIQINIEIEISIKKSYQS